MIDKNLGNIERILRLFTGLLFLGWTATLPTLNAIEWFVALVSLFLILNGVFGRCYLWYVLNIDTTDESKGLGIADRSCEQA